MKLPRIYADAAAATPLSKPARKELLRLLDIYGNAGALHQEAVIAKEELDSARATIATAIGAHPDEIIFTASGTEGNNIAINGILRPLLHAVGELHAITLSIEHQSVLEPLRALEVDGLYTTEMPVDHEGLVSLSGLKETINDETVFISIQLVNSEVGTIEPLREIAKLVRQVRKERAARVVGDEVPLPLYLHSDASQAPLWIDMKVESLGIDLITLDGQKVLGPKGVGALYIKRNTDIEPVIRGGVQEFGLRGGTPNVPMVGSFAIAFREAQKGVVARGLKVAGVRDYLFAEIKKLIPSVLINGPQMHVSAHKEKGTRRATKPSLAPLSSIYRVANNLNISIPGLDAEMAVLAMDARGIAVSTRSACNTGDEQPSHVIKALGTSKELAKTAIRITLLPDITRAEAKRIARALREVVDMYGAASH